MSEYAGQQFVGIDLHRRRSVIVRTTDAGEVLETVRIVNDVDRLNSVIDRAGADPEVVLEATYGWYWAADALQAAGARVHLAHPLGVKAFEYRRVKNDVRDATDLADLLRMGRLPEAWIAPPATRELRELVRHRAKLVGLRSHCKAEVHAVLAKCGIQVSLTDLFGVAGNDLLDRLQPAGTVRGPGVLAAQAAGGPGVRDRPVHRPGPGSTAQDPGYVAVQQIPGIGPILAAVFVAEIGDVTRFGTAPQLACWAGLTPKHHESDTHVHRGRITKQGSRLVRWAAVESVQVAAFDQPGRRDPRPGRGARRGRNIGAVAAARQQVEYVFYALRDHHVRALHPPRTGGGMRPASPHGSGRSRVVQVMTPTSVTRGGEVDPAD